METPGFPRSPTRRRPRSSLKRKATTSARHSRMALSRMVSKVGCKSAGELAMARNTSDIAACCATSSIICSCSSAGDAIRLRDARPPAGPLVRASPGNLFLGGPDLPSTRVQAAVAACSIEADGAAGHKALISASKARPRSGPCPVGVVSFSIRPLIISTVRFLAERRQR